MVGWALLTGCLVFSLSGGNDATSTNNVPTFVAETAAADVPYTFPHSAEPTYWIGFNDQVAVRTRWLGRVDFHVKHLRLPERLLESVIWHESRWDSAAVNASDPSYGLGQVMPRYWRHAFVTECGEEATSRTLMRAELNICYTAHILAHYMRIHGDERKALNAYNNGTGRESTYADKVLEEQ